MSKSHIKLPNLDSIRAIAALMAVLWHVELRKGEMHLANLPHFHNFGGIGVTIFYVLSGFLITYLLFREHTFNKKVNIRKFYFRRILRIWPLYFLVLLFGILIYPGNISSSAILLCFFFLPNIAFLLGKLPALIDPIWSLGVEEQFYLFHPHFFRMKKAARIFNTLILMFVFFYALKLMASKLQIEFLQNILFFARFDCMMLGGIISMWVSNQLSDNKLFKTTLSPEFLFSKMSQIVIFTGTIGYIYYGIWINPAGYSNQIFSFLVAGSIANLALNPKCIISVENKLLNFTGKVSFGLYLLHKFIIEIVLDLVIRLQINSTLLQNILIYGLVIPLAIGLAYISFKYYESYFLKLKDKKYSTEPK